MVKLYQLKTKGFYKIELDGEFVNTWYRWIYIWLNSSTVIDTAKDANSANDNNDYSRFNMYFIREFNENDKIKFQVHIANYMGNKYFSNIKILFTKL